MSPLPINKKTYFKVILGDKFIAEWRYFSEIVKIVPVLFSRGRFSIIVMPTVISNNTDNSFVTYPTTVLNRWFNYPSSRYTYISASAKRRDEFWNAFLMKGNRQLTFGDNNYAEYFQRQASIITILWIWEKCLLLSSVVNAFSTLIVKDNFLDL